MEFLFLLLVLSLLRDAFALGYSPFILEEPREVVRTEAGSIRVLPADEQGSLADHNIWVSNIHMESKALVLPHYRDASCVIYVHKGEMKLGWVKGGEHSKLDMKAGDIYALPGGVVSYILNTAEAQRLTVYILCNTSHSVQHGRVQRFFVTGGCDPRTVISGFDEATMAAAFKVPARTIAGLLKSQDRGAIVYTSPPEYEHLNGKEDSEEESKEDSKPRAFNILRKKPDFENDNGRTIAVDGDEFEPLKVVGAGVFAVNLKAGAMLAPHWNPTSAELAFVTKGHGTVQVSYPNGTCALNEAVKEGTFFFVPRYFPLCQVASRDGDLEFVGFTTSAEASHPEFLSGSNSVLKGLGSSILSLSFGVKEHSVRKLVESQEDAVILPGFTRDDESGVAAVL